VVQLERATERLEKQAHGDLGGPDGLLAEASRTQQRLGQAGLTQPVDFDAAYVHAPRA